MKGAKMEVKTKNNLHHIAVYIVQGKLDAYSYKKLEVDHTRHFVNGGQCFIVDLREVTFIDSTGLSALVRMYKQVQNAGGKLLIVRPHHPSATNILSITRFDQVFFMIDSLDAALSYLNDPGTS